MTPWRSRLRGALVGLSVTWAALALGGCMCSLDFGSDDRPCAVGTACPDGTCVLTIFGGGGDDICCGHGGECHPCPTGLWAGTYECPDGTCAWSSEDCCYHGGACDPGETEGPEPAATFGSTGEGEGTETETGSGEGTATEASSGGTTEDGIDGTAEGGSSAGSETEGGSGESTGGSEGSSTGGSSTG